MLSAASIFGSTSGVVTSIAWVSLVEPKILRHRAANLNSLILEHRHRLQPYARRVAYQLVFPGGAIADTITRPANCATSCSSSRARRQLFVQRLKEIITSTEVRL